MASDENFEASGPLPVHLREREASGPLHEHLREQREPRPAIDYV